MYNRVTRIYHDLTNFMEDEEIPDPFNEFNLAALHYMFWPLINESLMPSKIGMAQTSYANISGYLVR